jgi:hypothetical protein
VDYADDDAVRRFEMWEMALIALHGDADSTIEATGTLGWVHLGTLLGDSSITRMKREALINAARIEGDAHLPRIQKAFPGIDIVPLVQALRVKFVEMRLGGT